MKRIMEGRAYGVGVADGAVYGGRCAKITGNDKFALQNSASGITAGVFSGDRDSGQLCTVYLDGVYETDQFISGAAAGNQLAADASTGKLKAAGEGETVVGLALSVSSGILRFKLGK